MTVPPDDTTTDLHAVIAALRAERDAALVRETKRDGDYVERAAHQGATVEVLQAMAVSPDDPKPVFELIVRRAHDLCDAYTASLARVVDGSIVLGAYVVPDEGDAKGHEASFPRPVAADTMFGRAILAREPVQLPDVAADQTYALREGTLRGAVRAQAAVPLMRDGDAVGAINITRRQTGEFSQAQIELLQVFAAQAVIAITSAETYRALEERTAALAQRNTEYGERIEHQSATIDVLKAMSASPGDAQPVFDLIVERARDLCEGYGATVLEFDGSLLLHRASTGIDDNPAIRDALIAAYPKAPERSWPIDLALLERRLIIVDDLETEPNLDPALRNLTHKSVVAMPLMRGEVAIGALALGGRERGGFSDSQIELLKTFAEQAVIAITSAETYRALQTRTSDLQETLEYQTATSGMLNVISRSIFDLQPVLDTVVETAARLCDADQAAVARPEGDFWRLAANFGFPAEYEAYYRATGVMPYDPDARLSVTARAVREKVPVHIHDVAAIPGYPDLPIRLGKQRTSLAVPLLREGQSIGVILLGRQRVEPFTDRQIELVRTFADQAVIAIENTRLMTEQREALEQQTATAEVLQVINANPGDLGPVFDMILEKAHRLCDIGMGALLTCDAGQHRAVATRGYSPEADAHARRLRPILDNLAALAKSGAVLHHPDVSRADSPLSDDFGRTFIALTGARTYLVVPLSKEGTLLGTITAVRHEVRPFSERQITLLKNFAAQAVIAMENARLINEQREALEQQTATAEVLQVINASPGNLTPVFEAILEKAHDLCDIAYGDLQLYDGEHLRSVAQRGVSAGFADRLRQGYRASDSPASRPLLAGDRFTHITDAASVDSMVFRSAVRLDGIRTVLFLPLRKDGSLLGMITSARREVRPFTEKEIALLENFSAQAVIAMENARLLDELRERTEALAQRNSEFGERIEQQSATIDVLKVMSSTPDDTQPVFELIVRRAQELCKGVGASLIELEGNLVHFRATHSPASHSNDPAAVEAWKALFPMVPTLEWLSCRAILEKREVHIRDVQTDPGLSDIVRATNSDIRSHLTVPLMRDGQAIGSISLRGKEPGGFTDSQVALLRTFAEQAVIAIGSVANFRALRERTAELAQRQEELRVTFENMGDGVAMFDETQHLIAWNRKFQDILDVPDDIIARRQTFSEYVHYLSERGEYGHEADREEHVRQLIEEAGQSRTYERTRPDGRVIEVRHNPVPDGGFVLIFSDITERKRSEAEIRAARDAAEKASRTIEAAYRDLKAAQANLIQAEKMASLGQLTAGIAHEIKNPLNFVNNFAALSVDLLSELKETAAPGLAVLSEKQRAEVEDVSAMLTGNLEKITEHGKRADNIVKAMLEHSRGSSTERRMVDLNVMIDEALNLAYHGARAQDQSFNITLERDFSEGIAPIDLAPQDMTRVFLNLFSNGFYAVTRRTRNGGDAGFVPTLRVTTRDTREAVEIRVRDNGTGIPADIRDKLFQPFFTTKPTGEGTGLGLSISYDIITQQHGGSIAVDSKVGDYSEFVIRLPRNP